jgi:23S rRNA (uracil1939-C5)-methyltransferase
MVAGGLALAREIDGRIVLVEGALPGETVQVQLESDQADHARARVTEVLDPSPARVAPPCEYARAGCGGCGWQHIDPAAQRDYKRDIIIDALRRIARVEHPPLRPTVELPATGYRTTVRVLVTADGRPAFRRAHSHDPIEIDTCLVAHPLIDEVLQTARFPGAGEATVRAGARTGERCAFTDVGVTAELPRDVDYGLKARVHEEILGTRLRVSARSFFQARPDGADALAQLVRDAVGPDRVVADLYAGVGLFGATIESPKYIIAVERDRFAVADARHNLNDRNGRVFELAVEKWKPQAVDVVVADPSRAGLGKPGAKTALACKADRIVLVSCDAAALARDTALLEARGYELRSVTPVDLFPHTPHVECVSVFDG